ncbi:MAG TPA: carboxypeptidase-like regulatory domain-containing protein [Candidatus Acidoferrales bacterium]|nr:carboxypeptidase-like regulatory domain-containing protein [Candidatus Acidoferrales bacterium]
MKKLLLIILISIPLSVLACWQVGGPPTKVENNAIKMRLTYDHKPIANSPVLLQLNEKETLARTRTDRDGWFAFRNLAPGEYRVTLLSPSHETFQIVLSPAAEHKTQLSINFYGDWCGDISVIADK